MLTNISKIWNYYTFLGVIFRSAEHCTLTLMIFSLHLGWRTNFMILNSACFAMAANKSDVLKHSPSKRKEGCKPLCFWPNMLHHSPQFFDTVVFLLLYVVAKFNKDYIKSGNFIFLDLFQTLLNQGWYKSKLHKTKYSCIITKALRLILETWYKLLCFM